MRQSLRSLGQNAVQVIDKFGQRGQVALRRKLTPSSFLNPAGDEQPMRVVEAGRLLEAVRTAEDFVLGFSCRCESDEGTDFLVVPIGYDDGMFANAADRGILLRKTASGAFEAWIKIW